MENFTHTVCVRDFSNTLCEINVTQYQMKCFPFHYLNDETGNDSGFIIDCFVIGFEWWTCFIIQKEKALYYNKRYYNT